MTLIETWVDPLEAKEIMTLRELLNEQYVDKLLDEIQELGSVKPRKGHGSSQVQHLCC
jgi:hypothetical protein